MGGVEVVLYGSFFDPSTGIIEPFNWENLAVTNRKMTFREQRDGGTYTYTLRRRW